MVTLDELKKEIGDETLTEEEVKKIYNEGKEKFDSEVDKLVSEYEKLDMDAFINRIGGKDKISNMAKINEKLDRSELVNGKLVEKTNRQTKDEWKEEWKKGFIEGFEEAYKRLNG